MSRRGRHAAFVDFEAEKRYVISVSSTIPLGYFFCGSFSQSHCRSGPQISAEELARIGSWMSSIGRNAAFMGYAVKKGYVISKT